MKTAEQIKQALVRLETDLKQIRERIEEIRGWRNAGSAMQNQEFFIHQMKCLEDLQKEEWQAEYRIRAFKYVLETDDE